MPDLSFRPYTPVDRDACLALFRSNTPDFFGEDEVPEFAGFLDRLPCPYYVVETPDGAIVGAGGQYEKTPGCWVLAWGMVDRAHHRQGVGRFLLERRIELIRVQPGARSVRVNTSHLSAGFFERAGFATNRVEADHYFAGLHLHEMSRSLAPRAGS
jgi:GNAT superfamily N-acetyltransferase